MVKELRSEFLQFPQGIHDDMLDTQAFLSRMDVILPIATEDIKPDYMTFGDLMTIMDNKKSASSDPYERLNFEARV